MHLPSGCSPREAKVKVVAIRPLHNNLEIKVESIQRNNLRMILYENSSKVKEISSCDAQGKGQPKASQLNLYP
jgi:hypothetical protein